MHRALTDLNFITILVIDVAKEISKKIVIPLYFVLSVCLKKCSIFSFSIDSHMEASRDQQRLTKTNRPICNL